MGDLREALEALAGGSLDGVSADQQQTRRWNEAVLKAGQQSFDFRVLLGLAIEAGTPRHGQKARYQARVGKRLDRSPRWVRETVLTACNVQLAVQEGVPLPTKLRKVRWRDVGKCIDNLREGRALMAFGGGSPPNPRARFRTALKALVKSIEALPSEDRRQAVRQVVKQVEGLREP